MGNLGELSLKTSYHKGRDDIARDFYLPCMARAAQYDRAVGYFRSTAFLISWPVLRQFVDRGGLIRILCSQVLASEDVAALEQGYSARVDEVVAERLVEEVKGMMRDDALRQPARILAALVARGTIDLQVALLKRSEAQGVTGRIFHDKLGLFRDDVGNLVMFKGSMNETWSGLAADGNLESVDVAASWMGARDVERARTEEAYFEDLWDDRYPGVRVRPFPQVARAEIEQVADPNWEASLSNLLAEAKEEGGGDPQGRTLRSHQAAGLASWVANDRRGILAFATGSGKTFTAIQAIREALTEHSEVVLVVVPDAVLFDQWHAELLETTADLGVRILRAGAGYGRWRGALEAWTAPGDRRRLVLATVQTARTADFRERMRGGDHVLIVADEVHRLGSPTNQDLMDARLFGARLGLSATPERAGDPAGTAAVLRFFGGVLDPRYTLSDAVRDGVLTPYFYRPHTVELMEDEVAEWREMTGAITRLHFKQERREPDGSTAESIKRLLIKRARVVKRAKGKLQLAANVMSTEYVAGQRWIIYCDDMEQLDAVGQKLRENGIESMPFHSKMKGDRKATLEWLDRRGGILVAIKCLDEGVDIPSVTHALILASSKNPREFIQRRGRVLRKAEGKALAYVHDAIVKPPKAPPGVDAASDSIVEGELARAVAFAMNADNPGAATDLQQIAIEAGLDWQGLMNSGVEDEDD